MPEHSQASRRQLTQTSQDVLCLFSALFSQKTWHRLVPLPFSYMQMSIIEVAESGELCCTSACGWCLPERRAKPMKRESQPSVGKTHLNIMCARQCQTEKKGVFLSFFLSIFPSFLFFLSFCPSWVTWPAGYMGHVYALRLPLRSWWVGGVLLHRTRTSAACCVIRQIQYIRDRPAPPLLSSRTSSYHISRSTTCWVHRAISIPHDPLVSLYVSAGDLGYVKHPHTARDQVFIFPYATSPSENSVLTTLVCTDMCTHTHTHTHTQTNKQTNFNLRVVGIEPTSGPCADLHRCDSVCAILSPKLFVIVNATVSKSTGL